MRATSAPAVAPRPAPASAPARAAPAARTTPATGNGALLHEPLPKVGRWRMGLMVMSIIFKRWYV